MRDGVLGGGDPGAGPQVPAQAVRCVSCCGIFAELLASGSALPSCPPSLAGSCSARAPTPQVGEDGGWRVVLTIIFFLFPRGGGRKNKEFLVFLRKNKGILSARAQNFH